MGNRIVIVDYGMGNIGSLVNMFRRIGADVTVAADIDGVARADKLLLPGVGAFDIAMQRIADSGLTDIMNRRALVDRIPVLGICLGMQLLTNGSDEGQLPGFGWIPARARKLEASAQIKVPHMGWNVVHPAQPSPLTEGLPEESRFYFVHSYAVHLENPANCLLRASHGIAFDAAIQRDNIYGAQFHPEKSHRFGMKLLANFVSL